MKYHTSLIELWILEHLFQRFSDFTYRWLRLTNFFWAVVCAITTLSCFLYLGYICIYHREYAIFIAVLPFFCMFVPITAYSIQKARIRAYDHATWGIENLLKKDESATRRGALEMTVFVICIWLLIGYIQKQYRVVELIWWISMTGYPTLSFCACNAPGKRF